MVLKIIEPRIKPECKDTERMGSEEDTVASDTFSFRDLSVSDSSMSCQLTTNLHLISTKNKYTVGLLSNLPTNGKGRIVSTAAVSH